jgi:hypothetical protein
MDCPIFLYGDLTRGIFSLGDGQLIPISLPVSSPYLQTSTYLVLEAMIITHEAIVALDGVDHAFCQLEEEKNTTTFTRWALM